MFTAMRDVKFSELLQTAYEFQPQAELTPAAAYDRLIRGQGGAAGLSGLAGGVAATAIVPYPPGIPLVMPGEALGAEDGPVLRYLAALQAFDRQYPAFAHDTHGIENVDGDYRGMRF
jgi:lysine decarboxylase/arginine decarboxylase